jgi:hemoglobin
MIDRVSATSRVIATATATVLLLLGGAGGAVSQNPAADEPLFERLGGLPAISLVVSDFVDEFIRDPVILSNPAVRERKTPDSAPYVKFQVTTLVCQATGGPCEYTGLDMREAHDGLNVSQEEWDQMVVIFSRTLAQHGVPEQEQEELFAILGPTRDDIVASGNR